MSHPIPALINPELLGHKHFEVFPGAWDKVRNLFEKQILASSAEVYFELEVNDDDVFKLARDYRHLFLDFNEEIQNTVKEILSSRQSLI